ncbi:MAG TPA: ROK family protein [Saprospiraceae bacterium]|jgi:predicted NBD/HSP70 family sugar kinase|nr:ROK family protein [Saprospiraceae bacterium]HMY84696.1 ROK family protein [Saprospiraceae bacterium]HNA75617.1 ROK family protein [Saprospiraceae bacterium]HNB92735.1 ROK family protein [Saprospiraceae bacterium]HND75502.1 ROK family protein [Saprospiraceae bacterium]
MAEITNLKNKIARIKILRQLFFTPGLTSSEISNAIDKSLPVTTQLLTELIQEGRIEETGLAGSTGGRRPQTYSLADGSFQILSVAMDQLVTRIALVDEKARVVGTRQLFELNLYKNPDSLSELIECIRLFINSENVDTSRILGIGIGMPGFVDVKKGINNSFLPSAEGSVIEIIEKAIGLPVWIDNDSSLIALAESKWGAAKDKKHVMVLNIGWGIGLGMLLNGKLYRGQEGFAGEFSHMSLFENDKLCNCGKYGCLETEASLLVTLEKVNKGIVNGAVTSIAMPDLNHKEAAAKSLIKAVLEGDRFAIEVLSESAYQIGRGVAILIHLLNPEAIVISGFGSLAGKAWIAPIQQAINELCIPALAQNVEIRISDLASKAELLGAAALVAENYGKKEQIPDNKQVNLNHSW